MSEALTLITIAMPSAPTVAYAPFATQVVHLTTGDDYFRSTDSVTFQGNTIEDISEISNEIDMSQGQGAYNTAMHGTISFADSCDGGRLLPFILNGSIPLIGASVFIQSEGDLRANPVTLYMQNPSADSEGILTFDLYAAQYTKGQKLIKWSATNASGLVDVGVVVGADPSSIDDPANVGRYEGVSVSTNALPSAKALPYSDYKSTAHHGNPAISFGTTYVGEQHPYSKITNAASSVSYTFPFASSILRDSFWSNILGSNSTSSKLTANTSLLISDGTNSEVVFVTNGLGIPTYGTFVTLSKSDITINSVSYSSILFTVSSDSMIAASSASGISLYQQQLTAAICAGASSLAGMQSAQDSGVMQTLSITSNSYVETNILYVTPLDQAMSSFYGWQEMISKYKSPYVWTAYNGISGSTVFHNYIDNIRQSTKDPEPTAPFGLYLADNVQCNMTMRHLHTADEVVGKIDNIVIDLELDITLYGDYPYKPMYYDFTYPFVKSINATIQGHHTVTSYTQTLHGTHMRSGFVFSSLNDVPWSDINNYHVNDGGISVTDPPWMQEYIKSIIFYAVTKFGWGPNPAVVIPSYFPGTGVPTNTPVEAIHQLQVFGGLPQHGIYVGSHTTYPAAWGRYIEPTANVNDTIAEMAKESWLFVNDANRTDAMPPSSESLSPVTCKVGNVEDVITEPTINYDFAGGSAQYAAAISHVDEAFTTTNAAGRYWSGWQEKDTIQLGTACLYGGTIVATGVLQDCIACICSNGTLYCSFDGGTSWPVSQVIVAVASSTSTATITCGNGVMLATAMNNSSYSFAYYSTDYGRSWAPIATINGTAVSGGALSGIAISSWYDSVEGALWLGGQSSTGYATIYKTTNGAALSTMNVTVSSANLTGVIECIAALNQPSAGATHIAVGVSGQAALLASAETGAANTWYAKTGVPVGSHIMKFGGDFRIFSGNTMYSSADLIDWGSAATTYSFSNCATSANGKIVIGHVNAADFWYSRDAGNNWTLITWMTNEYAGAPGWLWDDYRSCFICPTILNTTIFSVGDPAVYQLWLTCRNAYLAHGVINSSTYDWKSIYNADDVIDMLLVQDGIDGTIEAARINWICKQPRYVEMSVNYSNVATQLSVSSAQRIVIPRQRLQDAGLDNNVPTYGIISSVQHNIKTGVSTLQIAMPPI